MLSFRDLFEAPVSVQDRILFYRSLATMFESGIPIQTALAAISRQIANPTLARTTRSLLTRVEAGYPIYEGMARHSEVFTPVEAGLVKVGMMTGSLALVLGRLAEYQERLQDLEGKAKAALAYPAITLAICLLMVVAVPPLMFGSLFEMLRTSGVELPWISRCLIAVSDLLRWPWFYVLGTPVAVGLGYGLRKAFEKPDVQLQADRLAMRLKWFGPMLRTLAVARFARGLSILVRAGLPLHRALGVAAETSGSPALREAAEQASRRLMDGSSLCESLTATRFFPRLFVLSIRAGEESGRLGPSLDHTARIYEVELDTLFEATAAALAPVVTVLIGGLVAVLNLATMLPLIKFLETM